MLHTSNLDLQAIEDLANQLLRDPAISGSSSELIPRRPMVDIDGRGFHFGGFERDQQEPTRIVEVRLISNGAPEKVYRLSTAASEPRAALIHALTQMAEQLAREDPADVDADHSW